MTARNENWIFVLGLLCLFSLFGLSAALLVDHSMILVLYFVGSFALFRWIMPCWPQISVFIPFLIVITTLGFYVGGMLPYFGLLKPEYVYVGVDMILIMALAWCLVFLILKIFTRKQIGFTKSSIAMLIPVVALCLFGINCYFYFLYPKNICTGFVAPDPSWMGVNSYDFIWNGLGLPIVGRVIPLELMPTYKDPLFTIYAFLIWGLMPVTMGWSVVQGRSYAVVPLPWYKPFFRGLLKILVLAAMVYVLILSLARLLVWIHLGH